MPELEEPPQQEEIYEAPPADPGELESLPPPTAMEMVNPPPADPEPLPPSLPPPLPLPKSNHVARANPVHKPAAPVILPKKRKDSLFEGDDIEKLLNEKVGPETLPEIAHPAREDENDGPTPVDYDAFVVSRIKATIILVGGVLALILAFLAGFYVRGSTQ